MAHASPKRTLVVNGREYDSLESAARAFGMSRNTLDYRLKKGWTPQEALGLEPRPSHAGSTPGIPVTVQGLDFKNIKEAARHFGRSYTYIFERLKEGFTIEQALGLVKRTDSFRSEYPEIATQWHPTRNGSLTPDSVTPHSGQRVWWLCPQGHRWQAVINSRSRGYGCPHCAGQKPTAERNFSAKYPELVQEWDWERNGSQNPAEFSPRSSSKVWWRCVRGHSWQATICNRTRGYKGGCPYCTNRKLGADNSLAQMRPDIAADWHPHKNAPITPDDVLAAGTKKFWWRCKHDHEWQTTIGLRVNAGTGCPRCTNQTSRVEIAIYAELHALFGEIGWRERISGYECDILLCERRIGVEIDGVYWHSGKPDLDLAKSAAFEEQGVQLFRLREADLPLLTERDVSFKWSNDFFPTVRDLVSNMLENAEISEKQRSALRAYVEGPGLINQKLYRTIVACLPAPPPGESFADKQPELAKEWAHDLNAPLLPEHFRHQANKRVWWRCSDGHTWQTTINIRTQQRTGCPECPRPFVPAPDDRNLAILNPELAREWHPEKNCGLQPKDVMPRSNRMVWWQCSKGHDWEAVVSSRTGGTGCPYCSGRFATETHNLVIKHPELLAEWDDQKNDGLDPSKLTPRSHKRVWWRCLNGHSWQSSISNRTGLKSGCPECARAKARKHTTLDMQRVANERGGECLSTIFTSTRAKMRWRCAKGHIWEARPDHVLYKPTWCPECARTRSVRPRTPNRSQSSPTSIQPEISRQVEFNFGI